jgi:hypothetical protein
VDSETTQLKLKATGGKQRLTNVMDAQQIFRIIQSIPSTKAEPFELLLAKQLRLGNQDLK